METGNCFSFALSQLTLEPENLRGVLSPQFAEATQDLLEPSDPKGASVVLKFEEGMKFPYHAAIIVSRNQEGQPQTVRHRLAFGCPVEEVSIDSLQPHAPDRYLAFFKVRGS